MSRRSLELSIDWRGAFVRHECVYEALTRLIVAGRALFIRGSEPFDSPTQHRSGYALCTLGSLILLGRRNMKVKRNSQVTSGFTCVGFRLIHQQQLELRVIQSFSKSNKISPERQRDNRNALCLSGLLNCLHTLK